MSESDAGTGNHDSSNVAARHQLGKFLLRHDRHWVGLTWTQKHRDWIRVQKFDYPAQQQVLQDYLKTVEDLAERVATLTATLEKLAQRDGLRDVQGAKRSAVSADRAEAEPGAARPVGQRPNNNSRRNHENCPGTRVNREGILPRQIIVSAWQSWPELASCLRDWIMKIVVPNTTPNPTTGTLAMPTLRFQRQILGCLCLTSAALLSAGFVEPGSEELSSDSSLWLSSAREQIEQGGDGGDTATAWATVAAVSQQIGDRVGYRQCMGQAVSLLKCRAS